MGKSAEQEEDAECNSGAKGGNIAVRRIVSHNQIMTAILEDVRLLLGELRRSCCCGGHVSEVQALSSVRVMIGEEQAQS